MFPQLQYISSHYSLDNNSHHTGSYISSSYIVPTRDMVSPPVMSFDNMEQRDSNLTDVTATESRTLSPFSTSSSVSSCLSPSSFTTSFFLKSQLKRHQHHFYNQVTHDNSSIANDQSDTEENLDSQDDQLFHVGSYSEKKQSFLDNIPLNLTSKLIEQGYLPHSVYPVKSKFLERVRYNIDDFEDDKLSLDDFDDDGNTTNDGDSHDQNDEMMFEMEV